MKKTLDTLGFIGCILGYFALMFCICQYIWTHSTDTEAYAREHNCRYDYSQLCWNEQEKPWLFND